MLLHHQICLTVNLEQPETDGHGKLVIWVRDEFWKHDRLPVFERRAAAGREKWKSTNGRRAEIGALWCGYSTWWKGELRGATDGIFRLRACKVGVKLSRWKGSQLCWAERRSQAIKWRIESKLKRAERRGENEGKLRGGERERPCVCVCASERACVRCKQALTPQSARVQMVGDGERGGGGEWIESLLWARRREMRWTCGGVSQVIFHLSGSAPFHYCLSSIASHFFFFSHCTKSRASRGRREKKKIMIKRANLISPFPNSI